MIPPSGILLSFRKFQEEGGVYPVPFLPPPFLDRPEREGGGSTSPLFLSAVSQMGWCELLVLHQRQMTLACPQTLSHSSGNAIPPRHKQCDQIANARISSSSTALMFALLQVCTLYDLAGHEKYLKTTVTGMTGAGLDYACLVIRADKGPSRPPGGGGGCSPPT